ncbi:MAG: twin-arginine translocation signal domain-containing protein [Bacteroidetes bacterium]|nr:twin-arginine translocation signal domain-containing protein [Bacteroidota bacterium]
MNSRRNFLRLTGALAAVTVLNQSFVWQPNELLKKAIKPARLKKGDKVAITSPAGAVWDEKQIEVFTKI